MSYQDPKEKLKKFIQESKQNGEEIARIGRGNVFPRRGRIGNFWVLCGVCDDIFNPLYEESARVKTKNGRRPMNSLLGSIALSLLLPFTGVKEKPSAL